MRNCFFFATQVTHIKVNDNKCIAKWETTILDTKYKLWDTNCIVVASSLSSRSSCHCVVVVIALSLSHCCVVVESEQGRVEKSRWEWTQEQQARAVSERTNLKKKIRTKKSLCTSISKQEDESSKRSYITQIRCTSERAMSERVRAAIEVVLYLCRMVTKVSCPIQSWVYIHQHTLSAGEGNCTPEN